MPTEPTDKSETSATTNEGPESAQQAPPAKRRRGFAAMPASKVKAIAAKGGVAAHEKGTAHRFTKEEAREAGRKGGRAPHRVRGRKLDEVTPNPPPSNPSEAPGA